MIEKQYTKTEIEEAKQQQKLISDVGYIKEKVDLIESTLEDKYITLDQFLPVKNIVYGLVGLILSSVVLALISLIIIKS